MIPRLKPWVTGRELRAAFTGSPGAVGQFEREFGERFGGRAVAFPYGRSALWALLKALELDGAEVVIPAYTCVVVAHAVVLSGNVPVFVDASADDYNMDIDRLAAAITERTRMIVPTHLFGCPMDVDRLEAVVRTAEARWGHKIWVVHDCAHAFGARWRGELVCRRGDAALFGLNISKTITSIFGGMITTGDERVATALRAARHRLFAEPSAVHGLLRGVYLAAAAIAFSPPAYATTAWLQHSTPILDRLTKAYHLDHEIRLPPDAMVMMSAGEASVGRLQLVRYDAIEAHHVATAAAYDEGLHGVAGLRLPPSVPGSTYSHYAVGVPDRGHAVETARSMGVELGILIEYSVPDLPEYAHYSAAGACPVARALSGSTVNLPVHTGITPAARRRVVAALRAAAGGAHDKQHAA